MGKGTLTIYSASAGSGKTYRLTGIYLEKLFNSRYSYRRILAVTFTHKATAEMKSRILDNLHKLSTGDCSEYLPDLIKSTGRKENWIRNEAGEILNSILHDFSRFSVSTIDSFFQKILRAFAMEIGLHAGFNIELDHSTILSSAIDSMIESAASDSQLRNWLTMYAMSNLDDEKSWNLKDGIIRLGEELFKEKFKILSIDERGKLEDKKFLLEYIEKLKTAKLLFENTLHEFGKKADEIYSTYGLSEDMFYRKGQGVPKFISLLASRIVTAPNSWVRETANDPPRWATGSLSPSLQAALSAGLDSAVRDAIHYYDGNILAYKSAEAVLLNIYALGIMSDVLHNVHVITSTDNTFLLSDAGEILNLITKEDQASFIYEKAGNRYENFMIDEFQDTSIIQWNNFMPLIDNSMAEGFDNLVVGDVKQSIYRWRNSDWRILGSVLASQVDNDRYISNPLTTNWRSRSNIIKFNNSLFSVIPRQLDGMLPENNSKVTFKKLYSEAVQADPGKRSGGYVRLEFIEDDKHLRWQEVVLSRLPGVIETFQNSGYNASDIGIIVRDGKEGSMVLKALIDYSNNCPPEKKQCYNYNVVSNDSLLLSNSPAITFIIAVVSAVNNPSDMLSRALMLRSWLLSRGSDIADRVPLVSGDIIRESGSFFPAGYEQFLETLPHMPLFEMTESIIRFFRIGDFSWNVVYLNTFQDFVVNFTGSRASDIQSFLDWWDTTGRKKSVVLPGNQDAMRILTIHKSKGLEFKVVILPFLAWNLDHIPSKLPFLWVKPSIPPINDLGIVPIKYSRDLADTIFKEDYIEEKYSIYLDNMNLLYVAFTRAKDAIYGFSVDNPKSGSTIAGILKNAILMNSESEDAGLDLVSRYNSEKRVFEYGNIEESKKDVIDKASIESPGYYVSQTLESLRLKLHGENYFASERTELRKKINYGKLMHEIFEGINTPSDISLAVRRLVLDGKLPEAESPDMEKRVYSLITTPQVAEWFNEGNKVMTEAGILLPSGTTRRPDRVIFKDGKTTIIDFKFGEENPHHNEQVNLYRQLLVDMGYDNIEAFIWYVDKNKIVPS